MVGNSSKVVPVSVTELTGVEDVKPMKAVPG